MGTYWQRHGALALIAIAALSSATPAFASAEQATQTPVANTLAGDTNISLDRGGRLARGAADVLVDKHGVCRWLDNGAASEYFVPYNTSTEWTAFIANAPASITRANCCPARTVTLTASDGQHQSFSLVLGREGASDARGRVALIQNFTTADGTENVSDTYVCMNGSWTSQGPTVVIEATPPATGPEEEVIGGCYTQQDIILIQDLTNSYTDDLPNMSANFATLSADARVQDWKFTVLSFGGGAKSTNYYATTRKALNTIRSVFLSPKTKTSNGLSMGSKSQMAALNDALTAYSATNPHLTVLLATDDADFGKQYSAYRAPAAQKLKSLNANLVVLQGSMSGKEAQVRQHYRAFMTESGIVGRVVRLGPDSRDLYQKIIEGVCIN